MQDVEYLSNARQRSRKPILKATQQFYRSDTEPCIMTSFQLQNWYHGTGVSPSEHPACQQFPVLQNDLPKSHCGFCDSTHVLVIALQSCVHPMSGDAYYDYEIVCQSCGGFTAYSYSEN